jgi:hypothetical protein
VAEYHQAAEIACGTGKTSGAAVGAHAVFDAEVAALDGDADSVAAEKQNPISGRGNSYLARHGEDPPN